eukprot:jgi/Chlat1/8945/Chrsp94S08246
MTTSERIAKAKSQKYNKNIHKRGKVVTTKKQSNFTVGPVLLGFFLFVVVGSSIFQIIRTASSGGMMAGV